jgi:hypothetical protein
MQNSQGDRTACGPTPVPSRSKPLDPGKEALGTVGLDLQTVSSEFTPAGINLKPVWNPSSKLWSSPLSVQWIGALRIKPNPLIRTRTPANADCRISTYNREIRQPFDTAVLAGFKAQTNRNNSESEMFRALAIASFSKLTRETLRSPRSIPSVEITKVRKLL